MAAINDPEIIEYSNVQLRPKCEQMMAIEALRQDMKLEYDNEIAGLLAPYLSADVVNDGREAEGVSRVTKNDILLVQGIVDTLIGTFDTGGNMAAIQKPTVRPLQVIL